MTVRRQWPRFLSKARKHMRKARLRQKHAHRLAILGLGLFPGMAGAGSLPHVAAILAHPHARLKIVAFGSSSTEGVGTTTPDAAYPAQLQKHLSQELAADSIEVINRGIGGEDIDDMLARLDTDILAKKPDMVIWQIGSNDPLRNVPIDRFEAETREGIARIRAAGADVILMEPQWCPTLDKTAGADRFIDSVRRIGAETGTPVIRRSELMHRWIADRRLTRDQMLASDGLHMTDGGYALLARDVANEIIAEADHPPRKVGPTLVAGDKDKRPESDFSPKGG
jgi:acyl-CoA thioesterase-1